MHANKMQIDTKASEILCKSRRAQGETLHLPPSPLPQPPTPPPDDDQSAEQLDHIVEACFPQKNITSPLFTMEELARHLTAATVL